MPLESFEEPLADAARALRAAGRAGHVEGGEAALLLGALHPEIDAVVAVSAPHVVWAALSQERPQRSSWTRGGEPLPFVPYDDDWEPDTDPVEFVGMYEQSLETYADRVPAARIPVERIAGEVLLVAGGDDRLWPSCDFAERIVARRSAAGLRTSWSPIAGRPPGGAAGRGAARGLAPGARRHAEADAALGALVWPHLEELRLRRESVQLCCGSESPVNGDSCSASAGSRHSAGRSNQRRCSKSALTRSPTPSSQVTSGSDSNSATASSR